ncbi:MAG: DUF4388 domain-containing protein [Deltaproteobacteria bacterium]|jgi:hypothetical protein|nr:DUF4388 domain-containing protein [Deltaproteobacteria bacterium]MBW2534389.1 DUF4388 domain-containing protein [Deltaproteobacteria bacterium]
MKERAEELVRVDPTGAAHPVGRVASKELRQRQGAFRLLCSPPDVVVLRKARDSTPDAPAPPGLWVAGELSKPGGLWDLVAMLAQGNWDGELVVDDGDSRREIFFERGSVIAANSTAERERLGEVLYRYGALTHEQIERVAAAVSPAMRFGEAAVRLGFLTNDQLFNLIGKQTEEIVYAAMLVHAGEFYFREGVDPRRLAYRLNLSVNALLMEGVRRMDEMECFRARIPSSMHVPARIDGQQVPSDHEHFAVWEAVDDARCVEEIGRVLGQGEFEATRALFQLMQAGFIAVAPPRPTGPTAIVALFNQAIAKVLVEVDKIDAGEDIRGQLASFATASGVYDALFGGAGPAPDGTLDADRIAESAAVLIGPEGVTEMLGQWLFEYASFAMFIAEPMLRSADEANAADISTEVAELLQPLAPEG